MRLLYSRELAANLILQDDERVRQITHLKHFPSEARNVRVAANEYLQQVAPTLGIPEPQLGRLHQRVSFTEPRQQDIEYRLHDIKKPFSSSTCCFLQTIHNTPVWDGGLTVEVKENPLRIVAVDHRGHPDLELRLPPANAVARVRRALAGILGGAAGRRAGIRDDERTRPVLRFKQAFAIKAARGRKSEQTRWLDDAWLRRGLFYVYRYDAAARQPDHGRRPALRGKAADGEAFEWVPTLPLPPLPRRIRDGRHYLVVELVFRIGRKPLDWKALVEIETGAILWLRPMTACVNGLVFTYDPKTSTGTLANTPDSTNAVLNPLRDVVVLSNLDPPSDGVQPLSGSNVTVVAGGPPPAAPPTETAGASFNYDARSNDFAAVNAYYHANNVFEVIEDLGFNLATYFDGTTFPVPLDHRASFATADGIEINAFCNGDAGGAAGDGIGLVGYCLSDDTGVADTTTNPLGRSVDKWVHWHEIGGHGVLYDHVNAPNFGFAHSAGDALAAFQNDPESQLRALPERFQYAPFRDWPAGGERWFNRTVADGWGWGGPQDTGGYNTEQILATTLFRVYRALGGDAAQVAKRWHASRVATYLVLNAVGKLSAGTNASSPTDLYIRLVAADADDWTSEGLTGGAYHKVIRWSFERQGLFGGDPPAVDLYIDDGRGGEYQYQAVHWNNASVWNRVDADGIHGQQPGVAGVESFAYVKVKNRGTADASGTVKLYHCLPGAGLTWPHDFVQAGPVDGLATGNVLANNGNEVTVGPFAWTPNVSARGHDCLIAIVETAQDPSNVANFGPGETIQEWRLVPHDNNVGQRNVQLTAGGEGGEGLSRSFQGAFFIAGNPFNKTAQMKLEVDLPEVLSSRGWNLRFAGLADGTFRLAAGEKRRIELVPVRGRDFSAADLRGVSDRAIVVRLLANGMQIGGMTYVVDPDLRDPGEVPSTDRCTDAAQKVLDCLRVSAGGKVKKVHVRTISVDFEMDDDDR